MIKGQILHKADDATNIKLINITYILFNLFSNKGVLHASHCNTHELPKRVSCQLSLNISLEMQITHTEENALEVEKRSQIVRPVKESVLTFPLRALLASPLESGPDEAVVGPHAVRGVHNQGHGCLTLTLGSYLTALPCSVFLKHSPAPFPRSTTHTETHAWSPPPPLLFSTW